MLIGQSADPEVTAEIQRFFDERAEIARVFNLITLQLGNDLMVAVKVQLQARRPARRGRDQSRRDRAEAALPASEVELLRTGPCRLVALARSLVLAGIALLSACTNPELREPPIDPDVARAEIAKRLPPKVANRDGWAIDIFAAFEALSIRPTTENICAVIAVDRTGIDAPGRPAGHRPPRHRAA